MDYKGAKYGNTPGNLNSGGIVQEGDWIYFSNYPDEDESLYRMRTDGSDTMLFSAQGKYRLINISGNWIYFTLSDENGIFRMKMDGTHREKITDLQANRISIIPDWIYFSNYTESDDMQHLYRVNPNGNGLELVGQQKSIRYF